MSSLATFSQVQRCLEQIHRYERVKENAIWINEIISQANLFTSAKIRELVKLRFGALFEMFVIQDASSYIPSLLCYILYKVVAFEYFYEFNQNLSSWKKLAEIPGTKECIVYQLASSLLLREDTSALKKCTKRFVKLYKHAKEMNFESLHLLNELLSAHEDIVLELFDPSVFSVGSVTERYSDIHADEVIPNEVNAFDWPGLLKCYSEGGVKRVITMSTNVSNNVLNQLITDLNPDQFEEDKYHSILGVMRAWMLCRTGFKLSITGKLCYLIEKECFRTESLKLLTMVTQDKSSNVLAHSSFLNFCIQILQCPELLKHPITKEKVEFAMAECKFMIELIRRYDRYLSQHGIISGLISELISFYLLAKKSGFDDEKLTLLEHLLKSLMESVGSSKKISLDLPFIMSNNLRVTRKPALPLLIGLKYCNQYQASLLATNLPAHEKQLCSLLMKHYKHVKTRVG